ncbi:MAG TPA: alkaline phosphatase D family protein [Kofleriaceae bacterium]
MKFDRRTFLRLAAYASAASALRFTAGCSDDDPVDRMFPQGIASGDPLPDGVLLWTRVETATRVRYEVAADPSFASVVAAGEVDADPDRDQTVRLEITGLEPGTTYYYRFVADGVTSPLGRTRTAPNPDADVPVRIALASCQDFAGRWFHAWRTLLERDDIDLVLFIGDYIYETIGHLGKQPPPERTIELPDGMALEDPLKGTLAALTLADYRALYRQYRRDPDLRAVHAKFPFVTIWDDHEFANDCWRDHATDFDDTYGDELSTERRQAATRAWYEHHPIRRPFAPAAGFPADLSVQRALRWGKHVELVLLDERYHRDDHLVPEGPLDRAVGHFTKNSAFGSRTFVIKSEFDTREAAAQPTMLGAAQRDWAISTVNASTATWKLLASPLVMAQMVVDMSAYDSLPEMFRQRFYFKTDQWDGFRSERRALLEACAGVDNLVVLSGDLHGFYAAELHADFDAAAEPLAVEYAVSAISAPTIEVQLTDVVAQSPILAGLGLGDLVPQFDANVLATNPHMRHAESTKNGLAIVDVSATDVIVTFVEVEGVTERTGGATREVAFRTRAGSRRIEAHGA